MIYNSPFVNYIYSHSPIAAQNLLLSLYGGIVRSEGLNPTFRRYRAELERTQWLPPDELRVLQTERLQRLIRHAYQNVPYYRRMFDERKLTSSDIRCADDLYKLPVLTKEIIRREGRAMRAANIPDRRTTHAQTGGTTGRSLTVTLDREQVIFEHAVRQRHLSWAGYRLGERLAMLRAWTPLMPPNSPPDTFWRNDWLNHRLYLSGYHLARETLPRYVEKLQEWQPRYLVGVGSNLYTLARYMQSRGVQLPMRAIFTGSEALGPATRRVIEEQFTCKVWDYYGTTERVAVAQQCEHGSYHQNVEFGVMQVDAPRGTPAPPGVEGELILTGLANYSLPLIRYAVEDSGFLVEGSCACGRSLPCLGQVEGRAYDVIVTAQGRFMPRSGLDRFYEKVERVERCQLIQRQVGQVTIRVQPLPGYGETDEADLKRALQFRLGEDTRVQVEVVDDLPVTATGKARFIISEVDVERYAGYG
jgi:phenylacetate-CoA ligase